MYSEFWFWFWGFVGCIKKLVWLAQVLCSIRMYVFDGNVPVAVTLKFGGAAFR